MLPQNKKKFPIVEEGPKFQSSKKKVNCSPISSCKLHVAISLLFLLVWFQLFRTQIEEKEKYVYF